MRTLANVEYNLVFGAKVFLITNAENIMYIITDQSKFEPEKGVLLTSDMLYINGEAKPDVFTKKGVQTSNHLYTAHTIDGGAHFVKVV